MPKIIHIHEDNYDMRSLYPVAAQQKVSGDLEAARAASERNRAPDGVGWSMYHITEVSSDYELIGLSIAAVAAVIEPLMPRVRHFYVTSFGGFGEPAHFDPMALYDEDAWCFGFGAHCYIKLEIKDDSVIGIWFDFNPDAAPDDHPATAADAAVLRQAFEAIDRLVVPSMVTDYWLDVAGPIADPAFLDAYFKKLTAA